MSNRKRYLNSQNIEIYKKYLEDRGEGEKFKYNSGNKYRMSDELYDFLFNNLQKVPPAHKIRGISTLYDSKGEVLMEWVKTAEDSHLKENLIESIVEGINSKIDKRLPFKNDKIFSEHQKKMINMYTITDFHFGMMAWGEESGDDWNLKIAEKLLLEWFDFAVENSPETEECIFAQLGDFLHWDGLLAVTPSAKHVLDVDTRFAKLVRVCLRVIRAIVEKLLTKHKKIYLIMAEGNHDESSSIWLREIFNFYYSNEPRIIVDVSPDPYYHFKFGQTILFFHHGHKRKIDNLDNVFVYKFKEQFGNSTHAYAHVGHLHHNEIKETPLMILERHRTLAAKDSYSSRGGFGSGRDSKVITYHKTLGEVSRLIISPEMVKDHKNE